VFKYRLLTIIQKKQLVFWAMLFPILLVTSYYLIVSNMIEEGPAISDLNIGIVEETVNPYYSISDILKENNDDANIQVVDRNQAEALLKNNEIDAFVVTNFDETTGKSNYKLHAYSFNNPQWLAKFIFDSAKSYENIGLRLRTPGMMAEKDFLNITTVGRTDIHMFSDFYTVYAILAMGCFNAIITGLDEIEWHKANESPFATRLTISAIDRRKRFIYSGSAAFLVQLAIITVVVLYVLFVLGLGFLREDIFKILSLMYVGTISAFFTGTFLGSVLPFNRSIKNTIGVASNLVLAAMAGTMSVYPKMLVDSVAPWVNQINPLAILSDGLYALAYYDTYHAYYSFLAKLSLYCLGIFLLNLIALRRGSFEYL